MHFDFTEILFSFKNSIKLHTLVTRSVFLVQSICTALLIIAVISIILMCTFFILSQCVLSLSVDTQSTKIHSTAEGEFVLEV